ncbi:DUF6544 family protein [Lapillicoccus sp.]|uniref:DUF6544 family protein n=1 Tax=Lapillicoccus sp. TaxID=1909287 RepID=UPI0032659F3E
MSAVSHGRGAVRRVVGAVVVLHGLLHLLGGAKGLGWSTVSALSQPIGRVTGGIWLVVALLVVLSGLLLALKAPWWWVVCGVAAVASQALIVTSWADAWAGTVVNVVLLAAAVYGWASQGPRSLGTEYRRRVSAALSAPPPTPPVNSGPVVTERDLAPLPTSVAAYVRRTGAVGRPRVTSVQAHLHGRIRANATSTWMPFTGEQVNTYGPDSCRLFSMDASLHGLPVDVLHVFVGDTATMRVRAASLVPMVDAAGPEMDRAETVTLFNDLCVLAPAALVDADVTWTVLGPDRVHASFTRGPQTIGADLVFDEHDELVDFVSDDRLAGSSNGRTFTPRRWSTPLTDYRAAGGRRLATHGDARWGGPDPQESFTYLELTVDDIQYDVAHPPSPRTKQHQ